MPELTLFIAAPQLYLDDSTLNRLNIPDLLDPQ